MANHFYIEHKDQSYNIFVDDEDDFEAGFFSKNIPNRPNHYNSSHSNYNNSNYNYNNSNYNYTNSNYNYNNSNYNYTNNNNYSSKNGSSKIFGMDSNIFEKNGYKMFGKVDSSSCNNNISSNCSTAYQREFPEKFMNTATTMQLSQSPMLKQPFLPNDMKVLEKPKDMLTTTTTTTCTADTKNRTLASPNLLNIGLSKTAATAVTSSTATTTNNNYYFYINKDNNKNNNSDNNNNNNRDVPVKRKRGRPRKVVKNVDANGDISIAGGDGNEGYNCGGGGAGGGDGGGENDGPVRKKSVCTCFQYLCYY
ncbi:hypothetical protein HELRODRAFT_168707 [Helobdella robusta]|uniref:Uncharacterized protein n=1 Tax=Helobdella robusta TaxID=6412 RepID=T1F0V7_HELRO|nr:hypothetical protein HELRODRAFT_168707 [Helobdella robusta]ESO08800.1 hypothetical protein HELRODRAFT_168707 [Helobdella robusta]